MPSHSQVSHREVTGTASALPGTVYFLNLQGPSAGEPYVLGCALNTAPAIPLAPPDPRAIPLSADAVFLFSILVGPPLFVAFAGVLDATGRANPPPVVNLPVNPAILGLRLYASGVSINAAYPGAIHVIPDPWGVTIGG